MKSLIFLISFFYTGLLISAPIMKLDLTDLNNLKSKDTLAEVQRNFFNDIKLFKVNLLEWEIKEKDDDYYFIHRNFEIKTESKIFKMNDYLTKEEIKNFEYSKIHAGHLMKGKVVLEKGKKYMLTEAKVGIYFKMKKTDLLNKKIDDIYFNFFFKEIDIIPSTIKLKNE